MPLDISVVVGAQNAKTTIAACLDSVLGQLDGLAAEVLVADSSSDGTADIVEKQFPRVRLLRSDDHRLVPHLWGLGMQESRASIVAITTAHCIPERNWIKSIIEEARENRDFAGIGGAIMPPSGAPAKDWAVYFSRYSAFMPPASGGIVADIPGDNAAYRKEALDRCWTDRQQGFWETIFHHNLKRAGEQLYMSPALRVALGRTGSARDYFRVRFSHGVHYGSTRPDNRGLLKLIRIAAAPILMPYLVLRIGARVRERRPDWIGHYVTAVPWLMFFMTAWSLGELTGYFKPSQNGTA